MNEVIGDFVKTVNMRFQSAFLSSFLVAAICINYRIAPVLFSEESYQKSFHYIDTVLYPDIDTVLFNWVVGPFLAATFYTFLWPLIDGQIRRWVKQINYINDQKLMELEKRKPVDREYSKAYFEQFEDLMSKEKARTNSLEEQIESIRRVLITKEATWRNDILRMTYIRLVSGFDITASQFEAVLKDEAMQVGPDTPIGKVLVKMMGFCPPIDQINLYLTLEEDVRKGLVSGSLSGTELSLRLGLDSKDTEELNDFLLLADALGVRRKMPSDVSGPYIIYSQTEVAKHWHRLRRFDVPAT